MRKAFKNFVESFKKDEKGMTLVELLAVIVILAIVGAIAFVAIGNVIDNSRQDAHISNAQQIINAVELAEISGETLTEGEEGISIGDIDNIGDLIDPWTQYSTTYSASFTLTKNGNSFVIDSEHPECTFVYDGDITKTVLSEEGRDLCGENDSSNG